jgi:phosphatidylglycerol:prolipoprotein diacylglycerol transferase
MYVHHLDPYAIKLWEGGPIRWYGLSYLMGFVVGYLLIRRVARVGKDAMPAVLAGDLLVTGAIGIMLGGRIGYALFYQPALFVDFTAEAPFWGLLAINRGGMASHGGMIGLFLATWYFARRHKQSFAHLLDLVAFAAPIGLFFGRIANFINGELYGRACDPSLPWAVKFPQELPHWDADRIAAQGAPLMYALDPSPMTTWTSDWKAVAYYVIDQAQRGNARVLDAVAPFLTPRHPSQLYEALMEGLLVFAVLAIVWARPRKPLTIGSLFCLTYGLVRIVGEQFRQPDHDIGFDWLGLTRGQWLSVALATLGLVLLVIFQRRAATTRGGWLKLKSE